ncbi:acyl-CoA thioester hydrolase [Algoriphagus alkaliphilus]|uniref:Acyl-CoA thioester hydrolase n=1 Tax=Algoriphagus alkaliphilus TaxID=279824 RepID=A0A1G5YT53_9BACT|nr:thioesterase family protein [Algoriphagus alkaliphilus]SDA85552.1 acyl-CoA thioester hydrolase [Algoriphagus alkaliphilus]
MEVLDPAKLKSQFSFSTPVQIRFSDIDGYLHVNNGIYFSYFEHARAVFLYTVCDWNVMTIGTVVGRIEIDYIRPIHLENKVEALVKCTRIGNSSFDLEQYLIGTDSKGESRVFSKCKCVMVSVDMKTMKPISVPEEYRLKLAVSSPQ